MTGLILVADVVLSEIRFACALTCNRIAEAVTFALLHADKHNENDRENEKYTTNNVFDNRHNN